MKTNRTLTTVLAALLLATTFASCSRRDQFRPPETDAPTGEQTTVAGQPEVSDPIESQPTGGDTTDKDTEPIAPDETSPSDSIHIPNPDDGIFEAVKTVANPYEGMTAEELYASFEQDRQRSVVNGLMLNAHNTPYYILLDARKGGKMYSKLTGQVMTICKDPLCQHTDCIFGTYTASAGDVQVSGDRIYIWLARTNNGMCTVLYSFDLLMDNPREEFVWANEFLGADTAFYHEGKVYYSTRVQQGGMNVSTVYVADLELDTTQRLWDDERAIAGLTLVGEDLWYTSGKDGSLHSYSLATGEDTCILSAEYLNPEEGQLRFRYLGMDGDRLYVSRQDVQNTTYTMVYDMAQKTLTEAAASYVYDGHGYTLMDHRQESFAQDPHYAYYQESSNYLGGDFYLCSADGEPIHLFRLATDGIPDQVTQFLLLDGHYVLFTYQTYKDFQNSYNPGVPEWERSIRFCFVDLYTGQAYDMGVDLEEIGS